MITDEIRAAIETAGVPVIVETTSDIPRVNTIVTYFGQLLENPVKATQLVGNIEYYTDLIEQRVANANMTLDTKTTFYVELTNAWRGMANGSVQDGLLVTCGGVNIIANSSVTSPTVGAEFVVEANPDVIIKLLSGTTNLTDYQTVYNEIISRPALQDVNAVKSGRVYVCYWYLTTGELYFVGELYFAKWLNPDLFADIDPGAIHAQMVQDYFGIDLAGTWVYNG
jgi:iron complex transport system substrate-binding protein